MPKYPKEESIKPTLSPEQAIELLRKQLGQIDKLLQLHYDDPEVNKWDNFTKQIIIKAFGKPHENLNAYHHPKLFGPMWMNMPKEAIQENYIKGLNNLKKLLEGFIEQLETFGGIEGVQETKINIETPSIRRKVFIVHGHNEQAKSELALILTRLGLEPIILHEQPSQGLTVIEKLEKHSDVGFAFVLLTPDDKGCQKDKDNLLPRARQNVVFEFGLFVGKLGRNRVCCLYTGNVDLPSDLQGLVYLPFKDSVNEIQLDIVKELKAAGYEVNL
jgi:hypothetical protein